MSTETKGEEDPVPPASDDVDLEDRQSQEEPEKFSDEATVETGEDKDHSKWYQKVGRTISGSATSVWVTVQESKPWAWIQSHKMWAIVATVLIVGCMLAAILSASGGSDEPTMSVTSLFGSSPSVDSPMLRAKMSVFPTYAGDERPHGHVTFRFDEENNFLMAIHMKGLEERCEGCKIRIHSGKSCLENPLSPALWDHEHHRQNPWEHVNYYSADGVSDTATIVSTGMDASDLNGHIVIMQDHFHEPIACGVLQQDGVKSGHVRSLYASISRMEPYELTAVRGEVVVEFFHDSSMLVDFSLMGLPPRCTHCQISIQEGTTCDAQAGSHYFDHENLDHDPWAIAHGAFYNSDEHGVAERSFFVYNGYGYADHMGHVLIVKGPDGSRIACGVLKGRYQDIVDVSDTPTLLNSE